MCNFWLVFQCQPSYINMITYLLFKNIVFNFWANFTWKHPFELLIFFNFFFHITNIFLSCRTVYFSHKNPQLKGQTDLIILFPVSLNFNWYFNWLIIISYVSFCGLWVEAGKGLKNFLAQHQQPQVSRCC